MAMDSNALRLRQWLMGCGAIGAGARFGVDWLGDEGVDCALITVPSPLKWRENVLGERRLEREQVQDFLFAARLRFGADTDENLDNLARLQGVADWIVDRNAAGDFPRWIGGEVTGITPTLAPAPVEGGAGTARYQIQIRVNYKVT